MDSGTSDGQSNGSGQLTIHHLDCHKWVVKGSKLIKSLHLRMGIGRRENEQTRRSNHFLSYLKAAEVTKTKNSSLEKTINEEEKHNAFGFRITDYTLIN